MEEPERLLEKLIEEARKVKTVTVDDNPQQGSLTHVVPLKTSSRVYAEVVLTNTDLKPGEDLVYWQNKDRSITLQPVEPTGNPYKFKSVRENQHMLGRSLREVMESLGY